MTPFDAAFSWMLPHEGGYVNDPKDPGGETKYGIAKRFHPDIEIQSLTEDQAKEIYRTAYWNPINGDAIAKIHPRVAAKVFDTGVNIGTVRAVKMLQASLIDLGNLLIADGRVGPATLSALGQSDEASILERLVVRQTNYYLSLNNPRFERGWLRRAKDLPPCQ